MCSLYSIDEIHSTSRREKNSHSHVEHISELTKKLAYKARADYFINFTKNFLLTMSDITIDTDFMN